MEGLNVIDVVDSDWFRSRIHEEWLELEREERMWLAMESSSGPEWRKSSQLECNRAKNRYTSYRPLESSRVILESNNNEEGSDYINASYIDRDYIACQAPLESTKADFWRMVWQKRCSVIVMVTDFEFRDSKACPYWPEDGSKVRYGNTLVFNRKHFLIGEIDVRCLYIRDVTSSSPPREVIHLQYRNWPDFGVPESTKTIQDLLLLVDRFRQRATQLYNLDGPMVVHCSAGVGRTGAFIACHSNLDNLRKATNPSVKQTVRKMRQQRQGMIRTEEQYYLIYQVLVDIIKANISKEPVNQEDYVTKIARTESLEVSLG